LQSGCSNIAPPLNFLLLTATISIPQGMGATAQVDPEVRLQQYLDAFAYYWALPDEAIDGIVLTENSGYDFAAFQAICDANPCGKRFIPVSTSTDYPSSKGKGYGEFFMLDQALERLRQEGMPGDTRFWKTTGRLKIRNLAEMTRTAPDTFTVYGDFRRVPFVGRRLGGNEWVELRLIAMTLDGYDRFFRGHYDDGYVIEQPFFDRLYPLYRAGGSGIVPRFRRQPEFVGVSGWSNKNYDGLEYRLKGALRRNLRRWAPGFWL